MTVFVELGACADQKILVALLLKERTQPLLRSDFSEIYHDNYWVYRRYIAAEPIAKGQLVYYTDTHT